MIEFRDIEISGKFRYLWLKYVTGYNLEVHCARSLKGEYSTQIVRDMGKKSEILLNEFPAKIVYLCGVAQPYNWSKNFHLALLADEGYGPLPIDELGIKMAVRNAIPLPIETTSMRAINHSKISQKAYATCRNWQFANFLQLTGILDPEQ